MAKSRAYEQTLKETLTDTEQAAEYLNAALEEKDPAAFLMALRDVANARGVSKLAAEAKLNRESLYRMLSEEGNPTVGSLTAVLRALGLRLSVKPGKSRRSVA
jgi:probable addiction module antidote protein